MAERFKQFTGLVDNCEFGTGQKEVTPGDLQGFWDMVYFQVCSPLDICTQCTALNNWTVDDFSGIIGFLKHLTPFTSEDI